MHVDFNSCTRDHVDDGGRSGPAGYLRYRLYVDGRLELTDWVTATSAEGSTSVLARACRAHDTGEPWMVEVHEPAAPPTGAYLRFGTDTKLMACPLPISTTHLGDPGGEF